MALQKPYILNKLDTIDTQLAESLSYKKAQGLISDYNTVTKTGTDNTPILQGIINALQSQIRADGFGKHDNVIAIPSGYYYFTGSISISPIIKLKPIGQVIFVFNGTGIFLDYKTIVEPSFYKEMWNRGSIIDGSNGSLMLTTNATTSAERVGKTAIAIGNSADGYTDISRYSLNDIGISKFEIGLRLRGYDNYLGTFDRLHIEECTYPISVDVLGTNSGENLSFYKCIFAGADAVLKMVNAFDVTFNQCSFDFNKRVQQWDNTSTGYFTTRYNSCYFEKNDDLVYGDGASGYVTPNIYLDQCTLYNNRQQMFKCGTRGYNVHLSSCDFRYIFAWQSRNGIDTFIAQDYSKINVYCRDITFSRKEAWQSLQPTRCYGTDFSNKTVGNSIILGTLTGTTLSTRNSITSDTIVNTDYCTGTTSLHIVASAEGWFEFSADDKIKVDYGDKIIFNCVHKIVDAGSTAGFNTNIVVTEYDDSDTLLNTTTIYPDNSNTDLNVWTSPYRMTISGLNNSQVNIIDNRTRYIKIKVNYSGFIDLYIDQVTVNVLK